MSLLSFPQTFYLSSILETRCDFFHFLNALILPTLTLITVILKVLGTVISDQLRSFLEHEVALSVRQYSFRSHRPTGDLLVLTHLIGFTWQSQGNMIPPDISNAFDRVWYGLLLKLPTWFSPSVPSWASNFLGTRTTFVRVNRVLSSRFPVNAGVQIHPLFFFYSLMIC